MNLLVKNIYKTIKKNRILNNISLDLTNGNVYGFVGRNGCGKSMLFRAISGMIKVDTGEILLDNKKLKSDFEVLPSLGMVLENADLFPGLSGIDNLIYLAKINDKIGFCECKNALLRVGLEPGDKRTYRKYSLGMKQKLRIAQAIMEKPDILILDEPTNGLDNESVDLLRKIIIEEKERGALVIISSHFKEDIDLLCDEVFYIENGEIKGHIKSGETILY